MRRFAQDLDENLDRLRQELAERTFETGKFYVFKVFDPAGIVTKSTSFSSPYKVRRFRSFYFATDNRPPANAL